MIGRCWSLTLGAASLRSTEDLGLELDTRNLIDDSHLNLLDHLLSAIHII